MPDYPEIPQYNGGLLGQAATIINSGINGGLKAYNQYQDFMLKKDQLKSEKDLQKQKQQADLLDKGMEAQPDENGEMKVVKNQQGQAADKQNRQLQLAGSSESRQAVKMLQAAAKASGNEDIANSVDENTTTGATANAYLDKLKPAISGGYGLLGKQAAADAAGDKYGPIIEQRREAMDNGIHQRAITALKNNKDLTQRLTQYQNLSNAMSLITDAEHLTPEQFDEAQQSVKSNLGIKGQGGVSERQHTYLKSAGFDVKRIEEFLSANPADIAKDNGLVKHVQDLARLEKQNISKQMDKKISVLTAGNGAFYSRRPDLRAGLDEVISAYKDQYNPPSFESSQQTGLIPQGMMNKGLVPNQPNPAPSGGSVGPHGATVNQGGHMYLWNPKSQRYE